MGIWLFLVCLLLILLYYDFRLRLAYCFDPQNAYKNLHPLQVHAANRIMSLACIYGGLKIVVDKNLLDKLPKTFLLISNHQSLADIPLLVHVLPDYMVRFIAKRELRRGVPALSFSLRKAGHALISRQGDFRVARREMVKLAKRTRQGVCPTVFPEGTRTRTGRVGQFHAAAVRTILSTTRIPVVAIAINGGHAIAKLKNLMNNLKNCVYTVKVVSIYPAPSTRTETMELIGRVQRDISQQVEIWNHTTK